MAELVFSDRWQLTDVTTRPMGRRTITSVADAHLDAIIGDRFEVTHTFRATSPQRRGPELLPPLDVTIPAQPGASYLLAVRQEGSGALSFHRPTPETTRRGAGAIAPMVTFRVALPEAPDEATRRSIVSKAIKGVVLKLAGRFADATVPWIGAQVEDLIWRRKQLTQGWLRVTRETLMSGALAPADAGAIPGDGRSLLLLHGTFSNAAAAFQELTRTRSEDGRDFFDVATRLYGERIYAFNHFTLSKTPEENARELLNDLKAPATFDVITHSRGGLVLRNLVERVAQLGAHAPNFRPGKVILVASPNQGTPLATADRFETLIGWWSNILEFFPENPFTTTLEYIGEALTFIARHVVDALPGLESMDAAGDQISALNEPPSAPQGAYSAIISNYQPTGQLLARVFDLGIDRVFGMANDLVVPTEGAWKVDDRAAWVDSGRVGCFGANVVSTSSQDVIHTTYFAQPETVEFVIKTLTDQPLALAPVNLDARLPFFLRRGVASVPALTSAALRSQSPSLPSAMAGPELETGLLGEADDVLQLFLISTDEHVPQAALKSATTRTAILLATYRNARVVETIFLRGGPQDGEPDTQGDDDYHWRLIIGVNEKIKNYVDGKAPALPDAAELHELGVNLFNAMFPGTVRRLYDVARVDRARAGKRLDIVITSMINWVADKPWEFAYDRSRQSFLANEAVNFTRNVLTAVPADEFVSHPGQPLNILVVVAQPIGLGLLSVEQEEAVVRRGFQPLIDAGLATIEFMLHARIDDLHKRVTRRDVDVLHFIGHGDYRDDEKEGYLIFENEDGGAQTVSSESLREVLCQRGIRLVFLNACETGMVGRGEDRVDFNRGVAPKLVSGGIPILVANQYKVLDVSAGEFARHFYGWLALGSTVGNAAREARVAVNYTVTSENIDWAVPVVYARNPGRTIYTDDERAQLEATFRPTQAADERRSPCRQFKGLKVGLWDVNHILPDLEEFARQLTARQPQYCFATVEVSAPLGTWRRRSPPGGGLSRGYIIGDEVAAKLRDHVAGLGLDRLICITAFALADKEDKDLALWNEDPNQRISIVSAELLVTLTTQRADDVKNRFLVNMVVSALSGFHGHREPPENCPNHESSGERTPEERLEYLTARQQFCERCKASLKASVDPLDRMLSTW